jgi:putative acetyltransferase
MKLPRTRIRAFEPADAPRVCEIFYRSVHEVAKSKYDQAQLDAWAPKMPDASKWLTSLAGFDTYLAINEAGEAVAWIAMTPAGYIDMLFCLPEALGRGIAGQLYETVERIARARGLSRMTAHASLLAQPFFAKRGWTIEKHEMHVRNGVGIPRAEMSKELHATR